MNMNDLFSGQNRFLLKMWKFQFVSNNLTSRHRFARLLSSPVSHVPGNDVEIWAPKCEDKTHLFETFEMDHYLFLNSSYIFNIYICNVYCFTFFIDEGLQISPVWLCVFETNVIKVFLKKISFKSNNYLLKIQMTWAGKKFE